MPARRLQSGLIVLGALLASSPASADGPGSVQFSWVREQGAESCPEAPSLMREVRLRLGRDPFGETGTRSIEGVFAREGTRWTARMLVRTPAGTLVGSRELGSEADSCAPLGAAVALIVALNIDPEATQDAHAATNTSTTVAARAPPAAGATSTPTATTAPARERAAGLGVAVRAAWAPGLLPGAAAGVALAGTLRMRLPLALSFGLVWLPEYPLSLDGARFGFGLGAGWLGLDVLVIRHARGSLALGAALYAGGVHAVVRDMRPLEAGQQAWLGASGALRGTLRLWGPLVLEGGVEGLVPLLRYRAQLDNGTTVFEQAVVCPLAYLGLGARFP